MPIKAPKAPEFRYVAANIVRLRGKLGLSQADLAERVKLDVTSMSRIERAEVNLTLQTLLQLAGALGVAPAALLKPARFVKRKVGRPAKE